MKNFFTLSDCTIKILWFETNRFTDKELNVQFFILKITYWSEHKPFFSNFYSMFLNPNIFFSNLNSNLYNNLSICVRPSVCPYAIYSLSFGPIWTLKVPMDFLGLGGGNKTICKVMGPKMKKKIYIGDTFFNSTTYLAVCLCFCHVQTLSTPPVLVWFEL